MSVILAIADFQIVGCLDAALYCGAESPWPYGWAELAARGTQFDQVDADMPSEAMAHAMIEHYKPFKEVS